MSKSGLHAHRSKYRVKGFETTRSRNCLRDVMTAEQEEEYYNKVLEQVIEDPRRYLDNLEYYDSFRCSFYNYKLKKSKIKIPDNREYYDSPVTIYKEDLTHL